MNSKLKTRMEAVGMGAVIAVVILTMAIFIISIVGCQTPQDDWPVIVPTIDDWAFHEGDVLTFTCPKCEGALRCTTTTTTTTSTTAEGL